MTSSMQAPAAAMPPPAARPDPAALAPTSPAPMRPSPAMPEIRATDPAKPRWRENQLVPRPAAVLRAVPSDTIRPTSVSPLPQASAMNDRITGTVSNRPSTRMWYRFSMIKRARVIMRELYCRGRGASSGVRGCMPGHMQEQMQGAAALAAQRQSTWMVSGRRACQQARH